MTPTIVEQLVPILIVLPGALGLAPRYFCQNAWLTMTDGGAPGAKLVVDERATELRFHAEHSEEVARDGRCRELERARSIR